MGVVSLLSGVACLLTSWFSTALVLSVEGSLRGVVVPFSTTSKTHLEI